MVHGVASIDATPPRIRNTKDKFEELMCKRTVKVSEVEVICFVVLLLFAYMPIAEKTY